MRSNTPYPCSGFKDTALRISMSRVPGSRSAFLAKMAALLVYLGVLSHVLLVWQGESFGKPFPIIPRDGRASSLLLSSYTCANTVSIDRNGRPSLGSYEKRIISLIFII